MYQKKEVVGDWNRLVAGLWRLSRARRLALRSTDTLHPGALSKHSESIVCGVLHNDCLCM